MYNNNVKELQSVSKKGAGMFGIIFFSAIIFNCFSNCGVKTQKIPLILVQLQDLIQFYNRQGVHMSIIYSIIYRMSGDEDLSAHTVHSVLSLRPTANTNSNKLMSLFVDMRGK